MQKTMSVSASIAMGLLAVALCGCAIQLPSSPYATALNNQDPLNGRICNVDDQGCLAMMASPPHACLIDSGHCNASGRVQMLDPNTGVTPEPQTQLIDPISVEAK